MRHPAVDLSLDLLRTQFNISQHMSSHTNKHTHSCNSNSRVATRLSEANNYSSRDNVVVRMDGLQCVCVCHHSKYVPFTPRKSLLFAVRIGDTHTHIHKTNRAANKQTTRKSKTDYFPSSQKCPTPPPASTLFVLLARIVCFVFG